MGSLTNWRIFWILPVSESPLFNVGMIPSMLIRGEISSMIARRIYSQMSQPVTARRYLKSDVVPPASKTLVGFARMCLSHVCQLQRAIILILHQDKPTLDADPDFRS